jgi:penicillin-binding protein 1A
MYPNAPILPPQAQKKRRKSLFLRFLGFAFTAGVLLFLAGSAVAGYLLWMITQELPDYDKLANYEPPVMTRVHANDGTLIGECATEKRIYVPVDSMPKLLINAFIAAEDQNFWEHKGVDMQGVARAIKVNIEGLIAGGPKRAEGASTITQQVAKNFLLTNERSMTRKAKEAILAIRIERAYSKEKILELYLNEIFLGFNSYGVAAAGLNYFGKELQNLEIEEVAYLAALPKAPSNYHPVRQVVRATERRNYVIGRMAEDGAITREQAEAAKKKPLIAVGRQSGAANCATDYFSEEVRRTISDLYGEQKLYGGGLSIRSTLDSNYQKMARSALREGLVRYDRRRGYRGAVKKIPVAGDWGAALAEIPVFSDLAPWRLGVVLESGRDKAVVGLQPERGANNEIDKARQTVELRADEVRWARSKKGNGAVSDVLPVGDVIYVAPQEAGMVKEDENGNELKASADPAKNNSWRLMQIPKIEGALVVMDPHTGRVLAIAGGFSYAESQFNRAVQAKRQPGSSFKPIIYAAAIDNGYTPSSVQVDAPIEVDQGNGQEVWKPKEYEGEGGNFGAATLRVGLEKSKNLITIRLANDIGMPTVAEYARRFGVYDSLPPYLSMALGAGETTLLRMTTAYCSFVNGGKQVHATLVDRIQDRYGKTIWHHDSRECRDCSADSWHNQDEPELVDMRKQVLDPLSAYQVTSMLEGVVKRGTGYKVAKLGRPLAGKTGTSNDEKDAWFIGFSPDLVVGVYIGYDNPEPMGKGQTGGGIAAPVFRDFMQMALAGQPAAPFRVPPGVKLVRVDATTGLRATANTEKVILEAFKPNEDPPDGNNYVTLPGAEVADSSASSGGRYESSGGSTQPFDDTTPGGYPSRPRYERQQPRPGDVY